MILVVAGHADELPDQLHALVLSRLASEREDSVQRIVEWRILSPIW
jgi:hypothetical protein